MSEPAAIVVMGVAGSGKTVVGEPLANRFCLIFRDGDEFHPPANIEKMSSGVPLVDADRWPWLDAIGRAIRDANAAGRGILVGCSALKRAYRERIVAAAGRPVQFVFLEGRQETIQARLDLRRHHFMPASLLASQFATLEPPAPNEAAIRVSIEPPLAEVIEAAATALQAAGVVTLPLSDTAARPGARQGDSAPV